MIICMRKHNRNRTGVAANMSRLEEKTLHTEKIFTGKVISLQVEDVELPNGNVSKREIIKHPGAVAILALTDDDKIVMVEQYRKALEKTIIEIPAGKLEHGEDPVTCAKRELETKYPFSFNSPIIGMSSAMLSCVDLLIFFRLKVLLTPTKTATALQLVI